MKAGCLRGPSLFLIVALLLPAISSWPQAAVSPATEKAIAAALKRDSALCRANADIDACYDAIRWSPGDPALLVSLADALMKANRPADALRNYHRAAALAPAMHGLAAKISAADAKLSRRTAGNAPGDGGSAPAKRFSNAAAEAQSH
jgi:cytochrome c-type biogenesis protein CcmH/NrfG